MHMINTLIVVAEVGEQGSCLGGQAGTNIYIFIDHHNRLLRQDCSNEYSR